MKQFNSQGIINNGSRSFNTVILMVSSLTEEDLLKAGDLSSGRWTHLPRQNGLFDPNVKEVSRPALTLSNSLAL